MGYIDLAQSTNEVDETSQKILLALHSMDKMLGQSALAREAPSAESIKTLVQLEPSQRINLLNQVHQCLTNRIKMNAGFPDLTLEEEKVILEDVFKTLQVKPMDDVFSYLRDGDVIEIYTNTGFQLYRNMEWFRLTSYSLLDVFMHPFSELYERPHRVIEMIWSEALAKFSNPNGTTICKVPPHTLREKSSRARLAFEVHFGYLSPLVDQSGVAQALLFTQSARQIDATQSEQIAFL